MQKLQNLHSHSLYCDGALTLEEMVIAAINKGCDSFGFSGHSYAPFDLKYCMSLENTHRYIKEVTELKEKYSSKIELFLGIEQEYHADAAPSGFDFIIGAVHFIKKGDALVCIDGGPRGQQEEVDEHYGGDHLALVEGYYETIADVARKTGSDFIAHYDLVAKYNFDGTLFDLNHKRYVTAALDAMDEILKSCNVFEVNTGAMYRYKKTEPSPSLFLLKELRQRGGEVILSSDSHDAESICYKFDEIREMLKACGFNYAKQLTSSGFVDVAL